MKVSVSVPALDVEFLDAYVQARGLKSRSEAVREAVRLLRDADLRAAYEAEWADGEEGEYAEWWDAPTAMTYPERPRHL